jgi:hypothetical protein
MKLFLLMPSFFGLVGYISVMVSAQPPPPEYATVPGMMYVNTTTLGQLLLFFTMIVTTAVGLWTQNRNRKWDVEDRARNHQWDMEDRERIKKELRERMDEEARGREAVAKDLTKQIAENTAITKEVKVDAKAAYEEANSVNHKIMDVNQNIEKLGQLFDTVRAIEHPTTGKSGKKKHV